jgi:DNA-directed RNA polymerase specialized sigma24 family protein
MDSPDSPGARGPYEARYLAFLETITHLRPSLHRYCSRMTGSVVDGEDVVQDALFQAYQVRVSRRTCCRFGLHIAVRMPLYPFAAAPLMHP